MRPSYTAVVNRHRHVNTRTYAIQPGSRYPTGVAVTDEGVNFSIYSRHATRVELLLFNTERSKAPFQVIELEPRLHRTFFFWHVLVEGLHVVTCYSWRIDGPNATRVTAGCGCGQSPSNFAALRPLEILPGDSSLLPGIRFVFN